MGTVTDFPISRNSQPTLVEQLQAQARAAVDRYRRRADLASGAAGSQPMEGYENTACRWRDESVRRVELLEALDTLIERYGLGAVSKALDTLAAGGGR